MSILPEQWLKSEQRVQVRSYADNGKLNDALELAEGQLLHCYRTHALRASCRVYKPCGRPWYPCRLSR
ncbi:MAG: hypothetical protein ACRYFK_16020 [Janthinobacterium lividum]